MIFRTLTMEDWANQFADLLISYLKFICLTLKAFSHGYIHLFIFDIIHTDILFLAYLRYFFPFHSWCISSTIILTVASSICGLWLAQYKFIKIYKSHNSIFNNNSFKVKRKCYFIFYCRKNIKFWFTFCMQFFRFY